MRFIRLIVDHFQGIEHADVAFGVGLNILYGPNDIGKSTLTAALRAALLLQHSSNEGSAYIPWQGDYTPKVQLTFADAKGIYHRVTKTFGGGVRGSAKLERSRDGQTFETEATARQVEEKLRSLLEWGILPPGGKTKQGHGLPQAFLAHVLLAEQTDVDEILNESFEKDAGESGRVRLTAALQAFAQDPRFKKVFDQVQKNVDDLFTATGKKKRGKGSAFLSAAEEVNALQQQLELVEHRRKESELAEDRVKLLLSEIDVLREHQENASGVLREIERRVAMTGARDAAKAELTKAEAGLKAIDDQRALVEVKAAEIAQLKNEFQKLSETHIRAENGVKTSLEAFEFAKEQLRKQTSDEASATRALQKAELEKAIAELERTAGVLDASRRVAEEAQRKSKTVSVVEGDRTKTETLRMAAETKAEKATKTFRDADDRHRRLRELQAYARWIDATRAVQLAEAANTEAVELETKAATQRAEAKRVRLEADASHLPDAKVAKAVARLQAELERGEAALGGGLSVSIRTKNAFELHVRADGKEVNVARPEGRVDAARIVELGIPELLDIEILAGDATTRRAAETLRRRWLEEGQPILLKAGVENGSALIEAREELDIRLREATSNEKDADRWDGEAKSRRQGTQQLKEMKKRAQELEAYLEGTDRAQLGQLHKGLKPGWMGEIEKTERALEVEKRKATEEQASARGEVERLTGQITQLDASLVTAKLACDDANRAMNGVDPTQQLLTIVQQEQRVASQKAKTRSELAALDQNVGGALAAAQAQLEKSKGEMESAKTARSHAETAVREHQSKLDRATGEHGALGAAAERLPRAAAAADVNTKKDALSRLPIPTAPASEQDRQSAHQRLEKIDGELRTKKDDLRKAEGALTQVGGAVVAERHVEIQAARRDAIQRQRLLDTDAEAWRLLHDALKESESFGLKHVGRVLAEDVSRRFQDLTRQKYGEVELDPNLATKGIQTVGGQRQPEDLSVGSRTQLATLIRLAIAESLASAIILDDQLVQTDLTRLEWFVSLLSRAATKAQVIVVTCRRRDYERPPIGNAVTWVDLEAQIKNWAQTATVAPDDRAPASTPPREASVHTEASGRDPKIELQDDGEIARNDTGQSVASARDHANAKTPVTAGEPETAIPPRPFVESFDDGIPFATLLKAALAEAGIAPLEFARGVKVGQRVVELWISGTSVPAAQFRERVIDFLLSQGSVAPESARARAAAKLAAIGR